MKLTRFSWCPSRKKRDADILLRAQGRRSLLGGFPTEFSYFSGYSEYGMCNGCASEHVGMFSWN